MPTISEQLSTLRGQVATLTKRLTAVETSLTSAVSRVTALDAAVKSLSASVNEKLAAFSSNLDKAVAGSVAAQSVAQGAAEKVAAIDTVTADLATLSAKVDALEIAPGPAPSPEPVPDPIVIKGGGIEFGISTHTTYRTSPQYSNDALTRALTVETGASYIRDLLSSSFKEQDALWRTYKAEGIKAIHATVGIYGRANDKVKLAARLEESADLLVEVTGFNEPDDPTTTIASWKDEVVAWQKWLYPTVKNNPKTAHIKVGLGALRGENRRGKAELQELMAACEGFFDFVDIHCYPGPVHNVVTDLDEHIAWGAGAPYVVISEFGGSTANMSLDVQARIISEGVKHLNEVLDSPFGKVYVYELWDDPDPTGNVLQSNFGIYESDGTPKPAVAVLQSFAAA